MPSFFLLGRERRWKLAVEQLERTNNDRSSVLTKLDRRYFVHLSTGAEFAGKALVELIPWPSLRNRGIRSPIMSSHDRMTGSDSTASSSCRERPTLTRRCCSHD